MTPETLPWDDFYFTARDGLRLYARYYAAAAPQGRRAVVCLPGLTRNGRDFRDLAHELAGHPEAPRDVYALDYRGRGLSQSDPDWRNYAVPIEMLDVLDLMTIRGLHNAAIVATSRGGIIALLMAAAQPTSIGAVVLNDIGPVIEPAGLGRITAYVGRVPLPATWPEAAQLVRELNARAFPAVAEEDWEIVARQWFNERNGKPAPGYDAKLANTMSVLDKPMPPLWPQYEALKRVPMMVIRGEHSDILSKETVDEMRRRHPAFTSLTVEGQGHAPLLRDPPTIAAIGDFLRAADAPRHAQQMAGT